MDSIVITDFKGKYLAVSQKKAENWGRTREEMIGLSDDVLMEPAEAEASWKLSAQVIETGQPVADVVQKVHRNGKDVFYSVSKYLSRATIGDEDVHFVVSITRDITRRMEVEELVKTDLAAILHEQKNIAVGHKGMLNYIISILKKNKVEKSIGLLEAMKDECDISENRIKIANLRIAQIGIEKPELPQTESVFDLREVFDDVLAQHKRQMHFAGIQIDDSMHLIAPETVFLKTVKDWVRFAIEAAVDNEIKYGETISKLTYGVDVDLEQDRIIFNISSNGVKIDEEFVKSRLFKKGQRAKNTADKEGTGFGLYAAREYMRQLGGEMWYEEETNGEWMGFYIALPLSALQYPDQL